MKADKVSPGVALKRLFACFALTISGAPAAAGQAAWESDIQAKAAAFNLGRPLPESPRPAQTSSPHGTGWWQAFERGRVYWLSYTGARIVWGDIGERWAALNREQGDLGFPLTDEMPAEGGDPRDRIQRFTGGAIYWRAATRETSVIDSGGSDPLGPYRPGKTVFGKVDISSPPPAADEGVFRVTLTGFTVHGETHDHLFEADGKGDEVYILADVAQYDSHRQSASRPGRSDQLIAGRISGEGLQGRSNVVLRRSLASVLMGDVNNLTDPPRVQAGSRSRLGGLRTGDRFPTNEPWVMSDKPQADRLPMLIWEGGLRRGAGLVIIIPSIWEWDGGNPRLRSTYSQYVNYHLAQGTYRDSGFTWMAFEGGDIAGAGDRPIGLLNSTTWIPQALTLTFETAERAAATSPSGLGTGVVEIRYGVDNESYSLYFKVERIK